MDNTEILLTFGDAIGISLAEQEEHIEEILHTVTDGKTTLEAINILTDGMDKDTLYRGAVIYGWLLDIYSEEQ